jgi:hypothetical protein
MNYPFLLGPGDHRQVDYYKQNAQSVGFHTHATTVCAQRIVCSPKPSDLQSSGPVCLNNRTRFISGSRAALQRCFMNDNSYGLSLLIATLCIVACTWIWNAVTPNKYRLSFDKAEKIAIYLLAAALVLLAIFISF